MKRMEAVRVSKEEYFGRGFKKSGYTYPVPFDWTTPFKWPTPFAGTKGVPDIDRKPIGTLSFVTVI